VDLVGEKVKLRAPRAEDAARFADLLADPLVVRRLGQWSHIAYGRRDAEQYLSSLFPGALAWTIECLADGAVIGSTGLHAVDHRNRNCSWGIWTAPPDRWGKGYGSETCRLCVRFAFDVLGMEKVSLEVYEGNEGARRAYEKAGFASEGVLRRHIWLDGALRDVELMAVFREHPLYQRV